MKKCIKGAISRVDLKEEELKINRKDDRCYLKSRHPYYFSIIQNIDVPYIFMHNYTYSNRYKNIKPKAKKRNGKNRKGN